MTKKERIYKRTLEDIAAYVLPSYGPVERPMVPLEFADHLRTVAKTALAEAGTRRQG